MSPRWRAKARRKALWLRAERQTGGRGRQGRAWLSPPGNLYAITLVRPRPDDPPAPTLALVAAVALHEAVALYAPGVRIKWPNDLLFDGAKLAGILLERAGRRGDHRLRRQPRASSRRARSPRHQPRRARRHSARARRLSLEILAAIFARWLAPLAAATASPRSAPPGSPPPIRSARRFRRRRAKGCSTASTKAGRSGCAWRMARPASSTPATCS